MTEIGAFGVVHKRLIGRTDPHNFTPVDRNGKQAVINRDAVIPLAAGFGTLGALANGAGVKFSSPAALPASGSEIRNAALHGGVRGAVVGGALGAAPGVITYRRRKRINDGKRGGKK